MARKRRQYRVVPENLFLSAEMHLPDGRVLQGYVLDLSSGGAGVILAAGGPDPERGAPVEVVLDSYRLPRAIRIRGVIRGWIQVQDSLRCGIEFEDAGSLERQVPSDLREEFNRRRFPRVPLPNRVRVQVSREIGSDSRVGEVLDLSAGGLRVLLPLIEARLIDSWQRVWVTFRLPDSERPLHLAAVVRNRFGMRVGLEFDAARTRDMDAARAEIQAYVATQTVKKRAAN